MATAFTRQEFLIKDLAVSIAAGARGSTWLPGPDDPTPPSPISPVAAVLANLVQIEAVRATILEAVKAKEFDEIGAAFVAGSTGGNPAIRSAIQEIGAAVVASAAFAAIGGGGSVGLPDPNCDGTSTETVPPTLTPVIHRGLEIHRVSELPRLKKRLAETILYVDKVAEAQAPTRAEVPMVRAQLEGALKDLGLRSEVEAV